jgi:hypothetical protein
MVVRLNSPEKPGGMKVLFDRGQGFREKRLMKGAAWMRTIKRLLGIGGSTNKKTRPLLHVEVSASLLLMGHTVE